MMTDMATKSSDRPRQKKKLLKPWTSEVTKATGTATKAKTEDKATEKKEESSSMKDQAIDTAAGHVKDKTGVEKSITKSAIKSVL